VSKWLERARQAARARAASGTGTYFGDYGLLVLREKCGEREAITSKSKAMASKEEEGSKNTLYRPKCENLRNTSPELKEPGGLQPLREALTALEGQTPYGVPLAAWKQAVRDGYGLLSDHGDALAAYGWPPKQVFQLIGAYEPTIIVPERIGLVWYVHGGQVLTLAAGFAAIRRLDGMDISYCWAGRRRSK
jgi:hypothetical protein